MASKKVELMAIPKEQGELTCYKCGIEVAVKGKPLKTPTGGTFWRGWCDLCLNGIPVESRTESKAVTGYGFKPGQEVTAVLTGKLLHPVPKTGEAVVLVGTRGYTVPMTCIDGYTPPETEEEGPDAEEVGAGTDTEEPAAAD